MTSSSKRLEYAVEVLPSYQYGLKLLVDFFGVSPETVVAYTESHLLENDVANGACLRKVPSFDKSSDQIGTGQGLINIEPNFVHGSVLFVSPPMTDPRQADDQIRTFYDDFVGFADQPALQLKFSSKVRIPEISKGARLWQIDAKADIRVAQLQEKIARCFRRHNWTCRTPRQVDTVPGRLHITLRDSRYKSLGAVTKTWPQAHRDIEIILDKLCITAACENHVEHSKRKPCGGALGPINFGEWDLVRRSDHKLLLSEKISQPAPSNQPPQAPAASVIDIVFHLEPARPADVSTDSETVRALHATAGGFVGQGDDADVSADMHAPTGGHAEGVANRGGQPLFDEVNQLHYCFKGMKPDDFQRVLQESQELMNNHIKVEGTEAKVFVWPHQKDSVLSELMLPKKFKKLRPFHVVIAKSLEVHLENALKGVGTYRNRPRCKRQQTLVYTSDTSDANNYCTKRTFLCKLQNLLQPNTVVQSTTEANTDVVNHRRLKLPDAI